MGNNFKHNIYIIILEDGIYYQSNFPSISWILLHKTFFPLFHFLISHIKSLHCTNNVGQKFITIIDNFNVHILLSVFTSIKS
jgi:hypothetical protein